jgi:RHS repeat-associated protein
MKGLDYLQNVNQENKFTFNGQTEKETKLNLNWHETAFRSYDPQLGRFHQIDPLADLFTGINPYQFGYNNPVLFNDPTGLSNDCKGCPDDKGDPNAEKMKKKKSGGSSGGGDFFNFTFGGGQVIMGNTQPSPHRVGTPAPRPTINTPPNRTSGTSSWLNRVIQRGNKLITKAWKPLGLTLFFLLMPNDGSDDNAISQHQAFSDRQKAYRLDKGMEDADEDNEYDYIYRAMKMMPDGFPEIPESANISPLLIFSRQLGAREDDIVDLRIGGGMVNQVDKKAGMSTSPSPRFSNVYIQGNVDSGKWHIFKIRRSLLPLLGLRAFDDSPGHVSIQPLYKMTEIQYQQNIIFSRQLWHLHINK